jgi:hypothetical protein
MKKIVFGILSVVFFVNVSLFAGPSNFKNPRIGIIISKASVEHRWGVTQMAAHGWAAIANLAGIPYDCLFISDLPEIKDIKRYNLLIFAQCTYVDNQFYNPLRQAISDYLLNGGNIIIDGPLASGDEQARDRDYSELFEVLAVQYDGFHGDAGYRLKIKDNNHYVTRLWENDSYITQHLVNGLNILNFKDQTDPQIVLTNEKKQYPFLLCQQNKNNRIVLVNDLTTWAGVGSFFRNSQPQVFYANQIFNVLVRAIHWSIYGDMVNPFPVPQVSNANLTAIVRLDADASGNLDAQIKTMNYLADLARESGVVPLYAWVSSAATKAGWQDLAPLGKMIEDVGGEIGTHSRFHRINREMNEKRWKEELDDAIREIEFNMSDYGYGIGKVEHFINPGNTIRMEDYNQIARRFTFYMTHGFEQDMPLGYGNLTWFTEQHKNFVVLENTPSPDYQWFYDPTWSYTTQQITAYEESIFDHMYHNIGRGVIFNEMWHDYSITSQPQYGKDRIMNKENIAFYDALKSKFMTHDIYCPDPVDLTNKICAMAQWNYNWESDTDELTITIDFSQTTLETIPEYTGGMGIKIENTSKFIQNVYVNDVLYPGFNNRVVILPNLKAAKNTIRILLGPNPSTQPRLTFISKKMPVLNQLEKTIVVEVRTKSKAKMSFYAPDSYILLNADWQEWNRTGDQLLRAFVTSDRKISLTPLIHDLFVLRETDLRIDSIEEDEKSVTFSVRAGTGNKRIIRFNSEQPPKEILLNDEKIEYMQKRGYEIKLPKFKDSGQLTISF